MALQACSKMHSKRHMYVLSMHRASLPGHVASGLHLRSTAAALQFKSTIHLLAALDTCIEQSLGCRHRWEGSSWLPGGLPLKKAVVVKLLYISSGKCYHYWPCCCRSGQAYWEAHSPASYDPSVTAVFVLPVESSQAQRYSAGHHCRQWLEYTA